MAIEKIKVGNEEHELQTTVSNITDLKVTATELNYMKGVTANIQTQLDAKIPVSRTVNGKPLTNNITLSAADVGATTMSEVETYINNTILNGAW